MQGDRGAHLFIDHEQMVRVGLVLATMHPDMMPHSEGTESDMGQEVSYQSDRDEYLSEVFVTLGKRWHDGLMKGDKSGEEGA